MKPVAGEAKLEWIGGRFRFPLPFREGDELIHSEVVLWLELPSLLLVGSVMTDPRTPISFRETLDTAIERPAVGEPRRPTRIRVSDAGLAEELRGADGIPIVVAPVPELDEVFADMVDEIAESQEPSYFGDGEITPAVIAELFAVARLLFRVAPWRQVSDQQIVRVDIPAYDIADACLSVIGAAGESFGLLLFRSIEDFDRFGTSTIDPSDPSDGEPAMRSLSFDRKKDLPPPMLREIEHNRWPVAGPKAYPVVISVNAQMQPLPTTERDVRIMTACTRAFLSFFEQHRDVFTGENALTEDMEPVSTSFTGDDNVTVTLTASYVEDVPFDDDDFVDDFFVPPPKPAPHVGRNDPCHCGSGKKYKKCHLDADQAPRRTASQTQTVREMDVRLAAEMARFASRRFGPDWLAVDLARDLDSLGLFLPWSTWTAAVGATSVAAAFVETNERRLSAEERDWCAAQRLASPSIWEVTRVQPGLVDVRDLLTGDTRSVSEERIAEKLVEHDTLLARVIDYRDRSYFGGIHRCPLTPDEAAPIVDAVRTKLGVREGAVPIERLRNPDMGLFMIDRWTDAIEEDDPEP
jgi:hypothetical protein